MLTQGVACDYNDYYEYSGVDFNTGKDPSQYVVYNSSGLFLHAKAGARVLNPAKTDFVSVKEDVNRVEISWDGFKLRDWNG